MVQHRSVGLSQSLASLGQPLERLRIAPEPEEHPAHAVHVGRILGLGLESLLDHRPSTRQVLALLSPKVAQMIQGLVKVRLKLEGFFEVFDALGLISFSFQQRPHLKVETMIGERWLVGGPQLFSR